MGRGAQSWGDKSEKEAAMIKGESKRAPQSWTAHAVARTRKKILVITFG